jgi:integrase
MPRHLLTDSVIKARIKEVQDQSFTPDAKNVLLGDGEGLYLSINKKGNASWLYRYFALKKSTAIGLGGYPATSLAAARIEAQKQRDIRASGADPLEVKQENIQIKNLAASSAKTFETCALEYIERTKDSWRNAKHEQQWRNTLSQYAYPVIGKKPISKVGTDDIVKILKPLWAVKNETATRLRSRLEAVLDWSAVQGWRPVENPARYKGHIQHLMPLIKKAEKKHHPSLPYADLPTFMKELYKQEGMARYALEFLILGCNRTSEVTDAQWTEIDFTRSQWEIPGSRMKAGVAHRIYLGPRMLEILKTVRPFSGEKYIFRTGKKDAPMSNMAMSMLLRRMSIQDITVHGFRSTYRVWSAERTDYAHEICEHVLAHKLSDPVAAAYARTDHFDKRKQLLKEWTDFALSQCREKATVRS